MICSTKEATVKTKIFSHESPEEDFSWLIGHRVVEASVNSVGIPGTEYTYTRWSDGGLQTNYREYAHGYIVLDNGVKAYIQGNEGCGGCDGGHYNITYLAAVDNIITDVKLYTQNSKYGQSYRIFVYAELGEYALMQVDGDDGSGWYGTGYSITVVFPDE
jgi:hypothetical protein